MQLTASSGRVRWPLSAIADGANAQQPRSTTQRHPPGRVDPGRWRVARSSYRLNLAVLAPDPARLAPGDCQATFERPAALASGPGELRPSTVRTPGIGRDRREVGLAFSGCKSGQERLDATRPPRTPSSTLGDPRRVDKGADSVENRPSVWTRLRAGTVPSVHGPRTSAWTIRAVAGRPRPTWPVRPPFDPGPAHTDRAALHSSRRNHPPPPGARSARRRPHAPHHDGDDDEVRR